MRTKETIEEELDIASAKYEAYNDIVTDTMTLGELYDNFADYEKVREEYFCLQAELVAVQK